MDSSREALEAGRTDPYMEDGAPSGTGAEVGDRGLFGLGHHNSDRPGHDKVHTGFGKLFHRKEKVESEATAPPAPPPSPPFQSIVLMFAMYAEAAPLISQFELKPDEEHVFIPGSPFKVFNGSLDGVAIHLVLPGNDRRTGTDLIGTVPAAVAAYAAIQTLKPDVIINAGTAGGFKAKGAQIGDVFLATAFANHDRRIGIPGYDIAGIGTHIAIKAPNLVRQLGLKTGVVTTGNSVDFTAEDMVQMKRNNASVKDMEGAAIAWVADLLSVPLLSIKTVTDIVDGGRVTEEEFLENLGTAAKALENIVPQVVRFVIGKSLHEL